MTSIAYTFIIGGLVLLLNILLLYYFKKYYNEKLEKVLLESQKLVNISYQYIIKQQENLTILKKELKVLLSSLKDMQIKIDTLFRLSKQAKIQHTDLLSHQSQIDIKLKEMEKSIENIIKKGQIDDKINQEIIKLQKQMLNQKNKLNKLDNIVIEKIKDLSIYKMN